MRNGKNILIMMIVTTNLFSECMEGDQGTCPEGYVCNSGSTEECTPIDFIYNQSTNIGAYFFYNVTLEGTSITSDDWVGAFNGDQCVGSRQWDTSICGGGICEVPVGPITSNDGYPTFKIFRASDGTYHDAFPSSDELWFPLAGYEIDSLSECESGLLSDCTGECGGLAAEDECGVCEGDGIVEGACDCDGNVLDCDDVCGGSAVEDCLGECGGVAVEDECGVCEGDGLDEDDDGICDDVDDCVGVYDECGMCNGSGIPNGKCDCSGNILDCFGTCGGSLELDCLGICGGLAIVDECGVCDGDGIPEGDCNCNGNIDDCSGVCGGDASLDNCSVCDNNPDNDCIQDCSGIWGGSAAFDECEICAGNDSSCTDCNGDLFGEAYIDGCNDCVGGNTGKTPCPTDCNGIEGGQAFYDECNNCVLEEDEDCVVDCAGVWGGDALDDECGICNGDGYEDECGVCDENSTNDCEQDCNGVWGGNSIDLGCGCDLPGPTGCDEQCESEMVFDCVGVCGGTAEDLGCGCDLPSPSGCDNKCGSIAEIDDCGVCGGNDDCLDSEIPTIFKLNQNYPNPFNASTTIEFSISVNSHMHLNIYDIMGKNVNTLLSEFLLTGSHSIIWNGLDKYGNSMPSGVYIAILKGNNMFSSIKLALIK